jgi:DHA1 family inner membrane transport protein
MTLLVAALAAFLVAVDMLVVAPILPALAADLGIPPQWLGMVSGSYAAAFAVLSLLLAPLQDRFGRRFLLLVGAAVFAASNLACATTRSYPSFLLFRMITGASAALIMPNVWAAVAATCRPDRLTRSMALIWTASSLGSVLGIPAGAFACANWEWPSVFFALAVGALIVLLALIRAPLGQAAKPLSGNYLARFTSVLRVAAARRALASTFFWNFSIYGLFSFIGKFYFEKFSADTATIGRFLIWAGLGHLTGSTLAGSLGDRFSRQTLVRVTAAGVAVFQLLMSLALGRDASVAFQVLWSFSAGLGAPALTAVVISQVPPARGAVMSLNSFAMNTSVVAGSALAAAILHRHLGAYPAVASLTALAALLVVALVPGTPPLAAHLQPASAQGAS